MFLTNLKVGEISRVVSINGDEGRRKFYHNMGFCKGKRVEILQKSRIGAIVMVMGVRIAMTNRAMMEVEVSEKESNSGGRSE